MTRRACPVAAGLALVALFVPSCVGPARSFGSFEGKAGATAEDMRSVVETARMAVDLAVRSRAFGPYISEVAHYAEDDAGGVQGAFDSIQPPDDRSRQLRSQLDELLSSAFSTIEDLRIAARGGDLGMLPDIARPLGRLSDQLDQFAQAHPSGGR